MEALENRAHFLVMLERFGCGVQNGRDLPQPLVRSTQLGRKALVIGGLLDEVLVKIPGRPQQLPAQRLEVLRFEYVVVADLRQVGIDRFACLAKVALGPRTLLDGFVALAQSPPALHFGSPPLREGAGKAGHDHEEERRRQAGDQRPPVAPAPGTLQASDRPGADCFAALPPPEIVSQFAGSLVPPAQLLGHRLQADRLEITGDRLVEPTGRSRLLFENLVDNPRGSSSEWRLAGKHLVKCGAERVLIGPGVNGAMPPRLLGAHVARSSNQSPFCN